jgi:hypothetical protein
MRTTFKILFLKENILSEITDNGDFIDFNNADFDALENYILLIDDSYFFYLTPDIPAKNTRKLPVLINNYLMANYPENLIPSHNFIEKKGHVLTYVISEELTDFLKKNRALFENASAIATPLSLVWLRGKKADFFDGKRFYEIDSYLIKYIDFSENPLKVSDIVESITSLPEKSLEFSGVRTETGFLTKFKKSAVIFGIAYIFFVSGMTLHLVSEKNNLHKIESQINTLYKKAGVANKADPYGVLLYRASTNKKKTDFRVLPLFEIVSVSLPNDTIINSFYYKNRILKIEGATSDFLKIDEFKNNLSKSLKGEVIIGNTIKQNDKIKFTITCKIKKID